MAGAVGVMTGAVGAAPVGRVPVVAGAGVAVGAGAGAGAVGDADAAGAVPVPGTASVAGGAVGAGPVAYCVSAARTFPEVSFPAGAGPAATPGSAEASGTCAAGAPAGAVALGSGCAVGMPAPITASSSEVGSVPGVGGASAGTVSVAEASPLASVFRGPPFVEVCLLWPSASAVRATWSDRTLANTSVGGAPPVGGLAPWPSEPGGARPRTSSPLPARRGCRRAGLRPTRPGAGRRRVGRDDGRQRCGADAGAHAALRRKPLRRSRRGPAHRPGRAPGETRYDGAP